MPASPQDPILVSKALAARLLSISVDTFERAVMPDIRTVRIGRRVLFPVAELGAWVEQHAARLRNQARKEAAQGLASSAPWRYDCPNNK